ncbi:MAG: DUF362 domain-containing protein [Acidimicrobiales bacterium]
MSQPRHAVVCDPGAAYPDPGRGFCPGERYPEYAYQALAAGSNDVYPMVRRLFSAAGLDASHQGTADWNPLAELIRPGNRVFVLCNFVYHRRPNETARDFLAKCVHGSVVRAVVDYALLALGSRGEVLVGNAAVQSCDWDRVLADTNVSDVLAFYEEHHQPVAGKDLRTFIVRLTPAGRLQPVRQGSGDSESLDVDLGEDSLLAALPSPPTGPPRYRVTDYDPARIESFHQPGHHRYRVHRAIAESDVVISVSKLKTHEKVGVTCGLKGFVGTVTEKDCLAHHRKGSPRTGGDEVPDSLRHLAPLSAFSDWAFRRPDDDPMRPYLQIADRTLKRVVRRLGARMAGSWHGNDTAWRMALDLARIAHYVDRCGVMRDEPQRVHLSVIDGIVAGEGDGPLAPRAVDAGALVFSDDVVLGDVLACHLMGFDPARVPIVREAFGTFRHPLVPPEPRADPYRSEIEGGRTVDLVAPALGRPFKAPWRWDGHLATSRDSTPPVGRASAAAPHR